MLPFSTSSLQYTRFLNFALIFTFLLAALLRFFWLNFSPPLLTQDEASLAYNARSIVETGRDEWGEPWPLVFSAFGDAKQPGMVYATAGWIALTGWRFTSVREVSALAGLITTAALVWWTWSITRKKELALVMAAVVGLSPWPILLSRLGLESNLALMFMALGLAAWTQAWNYSKRRPMWLSLGALSLVLSTYTYIAYRLSLPLLLGALALWLGWQSWRGQAKQKRVLQSLLLATAGTILLILPGFLLGSTTRLNQVGLLRPEARQAPQTAWRNGCHTWTFQQEVPLLRIGCVVLWNSVTMPAHLVLRSAVRHISPSFWFVEGDDLIYRNPTQTGAFYFLLIIPALFGLLAAWRGHQWAQRAVLSIVIGSVPSIMTDTPQAIRLTPALIGMAVLITLGVQQLQDELPSRWRTLTPWGVWKLVVGLCLLTLPLFLTQTHLNSTAWLGHGSILAEEATVAFTEDQKVHIDPQILPEPHIFLAFWHNLPPAEYQALEKAPQVDALGFQRPTQLGENIFFHTRNWGEYACSLTPDVRERTVLITTPEHAPGLSSSHSRTEASGVHTVLTVTTFPTDDASLAEQAEFCAQYQTADAPEVIQ